MVVNNNVWIKNGRFVIDLDIVVLMKVICFFLWLWDKDEVIFELSGLVIWNVGYILNINKDDRSRYLILIGIRYGWILFENLLIVEFK